MLVYSRISYLSKLGIGLAVRVLGLLENLVQLDLQVPFLLTTCLWQHRETHTQTVGLLEMYGKLTENVKL